MLRWGWTEAAHNTPSSVRRELLCFDRVEVSVSGHPRVLSPEEFLALPFDERIRLNVERKLRFLNGSQVVSSTDAMRSLIRAARPAPAI